jgi:hypothetical protein
MDEGPKRPIRLSATSSKLRWLEIRPPMTLLRVWIWYPVPYPCITSDEVDFIVDLWYFSVCDEMEWDTSGPIT